MNKFFSFFALVISTSLWASDAVISEQQSQFFDNLQQHCGKTYFGKTIYPDDPGHDFAGKKLEMRVASCSDKEIRIPFKVGEDTSRTWIITKTEKGMLFKHDHRHKDGTPHELTMYGGYANDKGNQLQQSFPADQETYKLVPKGKTNVWTLTLDPENKQFFYYLERHQKPRYKAVFDLKQ